MIYVAWEIEEISMTMHVFCSSLSAMIVAQCKKNGRNWKAAKSNGYWAKRGC